jgi:hypothetical protein
MEIVTARSTDGGATWSVPISIDEPGVSSAVDVHPRLAVDGSGRAVVLWGSSGGTNEETLMSAQSTDLGLTWSAPTVVPGGEAAFFGTVLASDTDVATDGRGAWRLVWPRASPLFPILNPSYDIVVVPGAVVAD